MLNSKLTDCAHEEEEEEEERKQPNYSKLNKSERIIGCIEWVCVHILYWGNVCVSVDLRIDFDVDI